MPIGFRVGPRYFVLSCVDAMYKSNQTTIEFEDGVIISIDGRSGPRCYVMSCVNG